MLAEPSAAMNRCLILIFAAVGFSANAQPEAGLEKGLIAHYLLDGNAKDDSGHGLNGAPFQLAPAADRFGRPGSAFHCSGQRYFNIPYEPFETSPTWSCWALVLKMPLKGMFYNIISIGEETNRRHRGIGVGNQYGSSSETGWGGGGMSMGTRKPIATRTGILPNERVWYHLVSVRTNTTFAFYVNGVQTHFSSFPDTPSYWSNPMAARIGARSNLSTFFNGILDDIRIYNRGLTADEVRLLYETERAAPVTAKKTD